VSHLPRPLLGLLVDFSFLFGLFEEPVSSKRPTALWFGFLSSFLGCIFFCLCLVCLLLHWFSVLVF